LNSRTGRKSRVFSIVLLAADSSPPHGIIGHQLIGANGMDYQKNDPAGLPSPAAKPAEDTAPATRKRLGNPGRRLLVALPVAAGIVLAASSAAFGANLIREAVMPAPAPSATATVVGDDERGADASLAAAETQSAAMPSPTHLRTIPSTLAPTAAPTTAPASVPPTVELGTLAVADNIDLTLTFSWTACTRSEFSFYELVYEPTSSGRTPSVLIGSSSWATPAKGAITARVAGIGPGDYQVRIEALGYLDGVLHVYGATTTAHVHLSVARYSASPSAGG
jgi:hypothetical protein